MARTLRPNEWIDRYVAEISRMLPAGKRADVEAEIRSLMEDELASRPVADEGAALEILRTFGPPAQVALRYGATQYLVGPVLYPIFMKVLRIVLAVTFVIGVFGLAISLPATGAAREIAQSLGSIVMALFQAGGTVVLIFAIIERAQRSSVQKASESWDPRSLAAVEDYDRASTGDLVATMVFTIVALLVFNFYLGALGRYWSPETGWVSFPLFSAEFQAYVPWLSMWWIAELVLASFILARGRWSRATRWLEIGLSFYGLVVMAAMLMGGPLAADPRFEPLFTLVIGILFTITAVEIVMRVYRLFVNRRGSAASLPSASAAL